MLTVFYVMLTNIKVTQITIHFEQTVIYAIKKVFLNVKMCYLL